MNNLYTAAREAIALARRRTLQQSCHLGPEAEYRALCLVAAAACEALSAEIDRCDHDCLHQTRSDIVQAIADDYAARATAWRKEGEKT